MRRKIRTTLFSVVSSVLLFSSFCLYLSSEVISSKKIPPSPVTLRNRSNNHHNLSFVIREEHHHCSRHVSSIRNLPSLDSILLPDWEVLLALSPEIPLSSDPGDGYSCLFQNNATSPAKPAGILPFRELTTFKCILPYSVRRLRPFFRPILIKSPLNWPGKEPEVPKMFRWGFLVYESLSTENDVILFVKGVNNRQGFNRPPTELRCVFGNPVFNSIKTDVISSSQEVFRCLRPNGTALHRFLLAGDVRIKVSLEIVEERKAVLVPSVAYYTPTRNVATREKKTLLCACTMVYNVAKFLKEWVIYHSRIGVEKFILYDNGSDDDLEKVVEELLEKYNVKTFIWPWPKTQEAGFSHCAMYATNSCTWMMYIDVDEFIFSPSWLNSSHPSIHMLKSFLPKITHTSSSSRPPIGQVSIRCFDFGPSNQRSHPIKGVTQGYTCRRRLEQRHKSIVLLEAIDTSLLNVIHHFQLKEGYKVKKLSRKEGVVNHYKYQAWPEFRAKFRRRVSAYVADWRKEVNPRSKDRTPGLGFSPIEPKRWSRKFCEVNDNRVKVVTRRWFGLDSPAGYKMAWQR
ncbi:hypothetical protein HHK36_003180 [Tetracentron sinense]|uniref:Glycosyltransferase family 92 protein n=1 Tax=Tetracentron sinense TaxID=13715 RepID=A0A834ZSV6_TETSI|nr:hypothetical protein HHK36_003180 [Tetracentron sinense]